MPSLIATFIQDATTELHVEDEDQLIRYCYGVAGTVGLMMSPILGAYRPRNAAVRGGIQVYEDGFPTEQFTKPHVGTDEFIG